MKNQKLKKEIQYWLSVSIVGVIMGFGIQFVRAWSEPTAIPPEGNLSAPINVSSIAQTKLGALQVNGFRNVGNTILDGNVGVGTTSPAYKLDVIGDVKGTRLCIANDCRNAWPTGGGGVTSVGTGAGLTGGPITTSGTISLNTTAISTCTGTGQKLLWDSSNSRLTCGTDQTAAGGGG